MLASISKSADLKRIERERERERELSFLVNLTLIVP